MKYEELRAIKPLTTGMVQLLKGCHSTEIYSSSHLKLYEHSAEEGLIKRGLIKKTTMVKEGKPETIYTVTDLGKLYLKHYFKI